MYWLGLLVLVLAGGAAFVYFAISGLGAESTPESRRLSMLVYLVAAALAVAGLVLMRLAITPA